MNCTLPKKVKPCYKCGEIGHYAIKCPKGFFGNIHKHWDCECHRCGQIGHVQGECPDQWRQFHATTKPGKIISLNNTTLSSSKSCFNCAKMCHFGHDCNKSCNGSFAVAPFVHTYDKWKKLYG